MKKRQKPEPLPPLVAKMDIREAAKLEIQSWLYGEPRNWARVVICCFMHRLETGRAIEEDFPSKNNLIDYQI